MSSEILSVKNICKSFGAVAVVDSVSFDVKKGEVKGLIGPNGAGKTTTMRMLSGFMKPDSGVITLNKVTVAPDNYELKSKIGYLPEHGSLYPEMWVKDYLDFVAGIYIKNPTEKKNKIDELISILQLQHVLYKAIHQLSKGYKRRVSLAQSLVNNPQLLILDEPTDGLDPNQKEDIQNFIIGMAIDRAIIISTHILDEVETLCHDVLIMKNGRIIANGTVDQLIRNAKLPPDAPHTLTQAFRVYTK